MKLMLMFLRPMYRHFPAYSQTYLSYYKDLGERGVAPAIFFIAVYYQENQYKNYQNIINIIMQKTCES